MPTRRVSREMRRCGAWWEGLAGRDTEHATGPSEARSDRRSDSAATCVVRRPDLFPYGLTLSSRRS